MFAPWSLPLLQSVIWCFFLHLPETIGFIDLGDSVEKSFYIVSTCEHFESRCDQMFGACPHLSVSTTRINIESSLSKAHGASLCGDKSQVWATSVEGGFIVWVNRMLGTMTQDMRTHVKQFIYAPYVFSRFSRSVPLKNITTGVCCSGLSIVVAFGELSSDNLGYLCTLCGVCFQL